MDEAVVIVGTKDDDDDDVVDDDDVDDDDDGKGSRKNILYKWYFTSAAFFQHFCVRDVFWKCLEDWIFT